MAIDYVNTLGAGAGFNTKNCFCSGRGCEGSEGPRLESKISESEAEIDALSKATSYLKRINRPQRS